MRGLSLLFCLLLVGACAARTPGLGLPAQPTAVTPRPGQVLPVARQHSEILVRTYVEGAESAQREIGGAACVLEAPTYSVQFQSPGRVIVPVPQMGAPAIDVRCEAGSLSGSARRGIVRQAYTNHTSSPWAYDPLFGPRWRSRSSIGLVIGDTGWIGGGTRDGWTRFYPDVKVVLR